MQSLSPSSLRQIIRTQGFAARRNRKRQRCGAQLWSADLEPFFAARSDPDNAVVCCISRSLGTFVTSFVVIAPPFLRETARLARTRACTSIVAGVDTCFNVERLKYTFNEVHLIHQRMICGRWRKTMWASALMCHPREAKRCYRSTITGVNGELSRLGAPMIQQAHVDYFPGLPKVIVECGNPNTHVVTGLRHMAKNMRRNQGAGREKGAPRLVHRKIGAPIAYCCKAATLPTKTMLHVFLTAATQRMRTAWGAVRWERYFRQTYTYTERLSAENAAAYGVGSLLLARWHYGMASGCVPGMGANNWQLTEGGHRFFKEPVKKRARNLKEVVEIYEEMIKRQTGPAHDEEKSYSRMGLPDCIATVPTRPDAWMMESGMIAKSPWHTSAMYLPSIRTYVDAYNEGRDASSPRVHMYVINDRVKAYVMRIGLPRPISRSFAKQLVWHLRTKRVDTLRTRWVAAGILEEQTTTEAQPGGVAPATDARNSSASGSSDDGTSDSASDDDEELRAGDDEGYEAAPSDAAQGSDGRRDAVDSATEPDAAKINMSVLGEQWGQHCVVMMVGDRARGTCFYACKTGHCQHKYTAMQLEEWPGADYTGEKIVDAKAGAAADRQWPRRQGSAGAIRSCNEGTRWQDKDSAWA